jgi:hypothetical protein
MEYDPKGAIGATKTPLHLLPPSASAAAAWAHKLGADKYGAWNWRSAKVCSATYIGAIKRHLDAWVDGEDLDPESGVTHLAHIIASCNILSDAEAFGTLEDNRPPKRPCNSPLDSKTAKLTTSQDLVRVASIGTSTKTACAYSMRDLGSGLQHKAIEKSVPMNSMQSEGSPITHPSDSGPQSD